MKSDWLRLMKSFQLWGLQNANHVSPGQKWCLRRLVPLLLALVWEGQGLEDESYWIMKPELTITEQWRTVNAHNFPRLALARLAFVATPGASWLIFVETWNMNIHCDGEGFTLNDFVWLCFAVLGLSFWEVQLLVMSQRWRWQPARLLLQFCNKLINDHKCVEYVLVLYAANSCTCVSICFGVRKRYILQNFLAYGQSGRCSRSQ